MKKIKSIKAKSPISSLKFQRKSDFKKFLNFIKVQTKQLKGISEPKENKIKNILGGKATSLGILGAGALLLFGGKDKDDKFETGKESGQVPDLYAAIGRRNEPDLKKPPLALKGRKASQFFGKTRDITSNVTRERPRKEVKEIKKRLQRSKPEIFARKERKSKKITKKLTKPLTVEEQLQKSGFKIDRSSGNIVPADEGIKVKIRRTQTLEGGEGRPKSRYSDYGSRKRFSQPKTGFPRSNVKFYGNMGFQKFFGATRIGKVRPKPGFKIDPLSGNIIPLDPIEQIIQEAQADPNIRKQFLKDAGIDKLSKRLTEGKDLPSERFSRMRRGTRTFSKPDPSGRITGTLTKNFFPEKSAFSKFTRRLLRGNPKITKDSFLGMSYKGPGFSFLAKVASNPVVKVVLLGFDILNTIRAGGKVLNPRDNLAVALYDLYVSINNSIFKDNPEKLKLYQSLSSDEKLRIKQVRRNMEIIKLKEAVTAAGGESGGNNIIVVPQNQQSNNVSGGGNEMPRQTGGDDISFFPSEPLNIGDDILLSKLNQ